MTSKPVPTIDDFEKLVGETFQLGTQRFKIATVEKRDAPKPDLPKSGSIVFEADGEADLDSGTHMISHASLGDHLMYVERVSADGEPTVLELILG